jgi:hypothetical protein
LGFFAVDYRMMMMERMAQKRLTVYGIDWDPFEKTEKERKREKTVKLD